MQEKKERNKIMKKGIAIADSIFHFSLLVVILLLILFSIYSIWDSAQVYAPAMATEYEIYKPTEEKEGYEELREINPEVIAWLNIYGTGIDYPLLQAEENQKYVHTDAKGKYSMTGSLFLDYRNNADFLDFNSIIYGHNMEKNAMFGSIHNYAEKKYFKEHQYGCLFYDDSFYGLQVMAIFMTDAYDKAIYAPGLTDPEMKKEYLERIQKEAIQFNEFDITLEDRILLLSTCTSDMTNGRYLLVLKIIDQVPENEFAEEEQTAKKTLIDDEVLHGYWNKVSYMAWFGMSVLLLFLLTTISLEIKKRKRKERKDENKTQIW